MRTWSLILVVGIALLSTAAIATGPAGAPHAHPPRAATFTERTPLGDSHGVPIAGSYHLPEIKLAGDGRVLDHSGRSHRLAGFISGRITLLSFIYTNCGDPEGCPLAMSTLFEIYHASDKSERLARNARLVTVSFDPERDTPEALASYVYAALADPDSSRKLPWSFLTTRSRRDLSPILEDYGQPVAPRQGSNQLNHLLRLYLIDRNGQIRNIYGLGMLDPRFLLADIETLLLEDGTNAARSR